MVTNQLKSADTVATANEIGSEDFIAEQGTTGVESLERVTNHKKLRTTVLRPRAGVANMHRVRATLSA